MDLTPVMPQPFAVASPAEVPDARPLRVEVEGTPLVIVRTPTGFAAYSARCPHAAGPMHRGWIEGSELVCPLHYWRFRLDDGTCTSVAGERLRAFPCEVRDDRIWVSL